MRTGNRPTASTTLSAKAGSELISNVSIRCSSSPAALQICPTCQTVVLAYFVIVRRLGIRHGVYCLGCCWLLMTLLFVGGVMNLFTVAAITAFVLLEKLLPPRYAITHISAWLLFASGVA